MSVNRNSGEYVAGNSLSYDRVAKFLHWLIALAIIGMLALGWIMSSMPNAPGKFALFQWHKSIGITILLLSLIRLAWRLMHPPPALPAAMPRWEKYAANLTHSLFYVLMIGMPFLGWIMVSASKMNIPTMLYGFIPWPHLPVIPTLDNKDAIGHTAGQMHGLLAYVLAGLIVLHIGAASKHHLIERNDVVLRMAPRPLHGILNWMRGQK
jgi:cytochrome b561